MSPRALLVSWFGGVLAAMLAVTVWASLQGDVLDGFRQVWRIPWARATLFDAYFAFVAVWLWIAWRERSTAARLGWLAAILLFGNFAIAAYFLKALRGAPAAAPLDRLFGQRQAPRASAERSS